MLVAGLNALGDSDSEGCVLAPGVDDKSHPVSYPANATLQQHPEFFGCTAAEAEAIVVAADGDGDGFVSVEELGEASRRESSEEDSGLAGKTICL